MLLECSLKLDEENQKVKLKLFSWANGIPIPLCHIWSDFVHCLFSFRCDSSWLIEKTLQQERWFFVFTIHFFHSKQYAPSLPEKGQCWLLLVTEGNIEHVTPGFALFAVVEKRIFFGWKVNTLSAFFVGQYVSPKVLVFCCPPTNWTFLFAIIGWLNWALIKICFPGNRFNIFGREKACFFFLVSSRAPAM